MTLQLKVTPLFAKAGGDYKNYWERINETIRLGLLPLIIVEGKSQTGKSTFGRDICANYDSHFIDTFRVEQIISFIDWIKGQWRAGNRDVCLHRWIFYDEPQLDVPSTNFWDDRNKIITAFTSSAGFLKCGLVMALPDMQGIQSTVYRNITLRIIIDKKEGRNREERRTAYIKKPVYDDNAKKYFWYNTQTYKVPFIRGDDPKYLGMKYENFFDVQLGKWKKQLGMRDTTSESERSEEFWKFVEDQEKSRHPSSKT